MWKFDFTLTKKIFRQINSLVTYLIKPLLSRNFCQKCMREFPKFSHCCAIHTVLEKPKIYCHLKNISWNQFTAWFISLVKQLFSRYFWEKMVTAKFRNFHTMQFSMFHFYQSTISDSKLRLLANNVSEYVCKKLLQFSKDCSLFRSSILQLYLQKLSI